MFFLGKWFCNFRSVILDLKYPKKSKISVVFDLFSGLTFEFNTHWLRKFHDHKNWSKYYRNFEQFWAICRSKITSLKLQNHFHISAFWSCFSSFKIGLRGQKILQLNFLQKVNNQISVVSICYFFLLFSFGCT